MLLKFFRRPLPVVFTSIIIIAILLWMQSFVSNLLVPFSFDSVQMPLYNLVMVLLRNVYMAKVFTFVVVLIIAFYLIHLNSKYILIKQRTYLPALLYILVSSSILPFQRHNPAVFACLMLLIAINYLFSLYDNRQPLDKLFKAGFFVSLSVMFYLPSFLFIILIFIAIGTFNTDGFRNWVVVVAGFFTPWLFYFSFQYLVYNDYLAIFRLFDEVWSSLRVGTDFSLFYKIFFYFIGFLYLASTFFLLKSLGVQKVNVRKYHTLLLWCMAITVLIMILFSFHSLETLYLAAFPVSISISNYQLCSRNKFWPEVFLILIIGMAIALQFL